MDPFVFDKIQVFSILFSLFFFCLIFSLVKNKRIREEYSLLWFAMGLFLFYLSVDRYAIDRFGNLFGIAYAPSVLTLMTTGFTLLLLLHLTVVITRISEQNKEIIQEMGLNNCIPNPRSSEALAIVPAFNEEKNIAGVIEDLGHLDIDILVINDGSMDSTAEIAKSTNTATVIDLPKNLGIGGAVQTGFKFAARNGYAVAIQFDADGQHLAAEIPALLKSLQARNANMVIGSRFMQDQSSYRSTFTRRIGIYIFKIINSLLIKQRVTDNTSGFRAYDRKAIEFLAQHYPVDYPEPEAVILLGRNGFRIIEVCIQMRERQGGISSIAGLTGIYYMLKVILAIFMTSIRKPITTVRR